MITQGTAITWKKTGGDYAITLASLANTKGRCGVLGDLAKNAGTDLPSRLAALATASGGVGVGLPDFFAVYLALELGSAPTAGEVAELYWVWSHDNSATNLPGGATGTDLAYMDGQEGEWKKQLELIGNLVATADGAGTIQNQSPFYMAPRSRYGCPVLVNNLGVALDSDDDNQSITVVPCYRN